MNPTHALPGPYVAEGLQQNLLGKSLLGQYLQFIICCKSGVVAQIYLEGAMIKIPCQLKSQEHTWRKQS